MNVNIAQEHRSWLYSAAIAVLITLWLLSGQIGGDKSAGDAKLEVSTAIKAPHSKVRVRTQSAEEIVRTIEVNGKTAPARIVELSAETDGRVEYIGVDRGASVKRGATIIRLDERDRRARLAQAEATVKQRELEYDARKSLETKSYVSAAQLQEALAQLEAARTERTRAEVDLDAMFVRAPFDGALQSRIAEVGDFVKRGDPVGIFVDNQTIIVSANLSEFDARYVEVGNSAEARFATGERVRGVIRYVAPVADQATRTFEVELEVDNRDGKLRAGGTAELYIPAETVKAHRISPSLLTLDDAGTVGLKLINDKGEVEFVAADIALSSSEGIWVAGLPDTATIITVGQGFVTSGSLVDAVPESDIATSVAVKAQDEE